MMDWIVAIFAGWLLGGLVFGGLGTWIAIQKHRPVPEGFILGFIFGPLGALIEALLPALDPGAGEEDLETHAVPFVRAHDAGPSGWWKCRRCGTMNEPVLGACMACDTGRLVKCLV